MSILKEFDEGTIEESKLLELKEGPHVQTFFNLFETYMTVLRQPNAHQDYIHTLSTRGLRELSDVPNTLLQAQIDYVCDTVPGFVTCEGFSEVTNAFLSALIYCGHHSGLRPVYCDISRIPQLEFRVGGTAPFYGSTQNPFTLKVKGDVKSIELKGIKHAHITIDGSIDELALMGNKYQTGDKHQTVQSHSTITMHGPTQKVTGHRIRYCTFESKDQQLLYSISNRLFPQPRKTCSFHKLS